MALKLDVRALFIQASQSAVANHIGCQNGGKPTLDARAGQGSLRDRSETVYASRFREPRERDGAWHPTEPSAVRFPSRLMMSGCGPNAQSGLAPNLSGHRIKPEVVGPRPYDAIDPRRKSAVNKASFQFPHRIKGEAGALSHSQDPPLGNLLRPPAIAPQAPLRLRAEP